MPDVARPAHLADVNEPLDAGLELDEGAVVRDGDNLARHTRADRILLGDVLPRVALELLESEADTFSGPIDVEDLDLELGADRHHLRRMRDASPRHVRDVEQAVDATEVDERTEVGDVLDDAFAHLILLELLHQLLALARSLVLEDHSARNDDVAATLVQLDDLELELLAEQLVDVRNAAERDLRSREERVDAHEVDDHAALDLLDQRAFHRLIGLVRDADLLPHAHEVRFLLRKDDRAFLVLEVLEEHFDFVAGLEVRVVLELFERNAAFGFEADVEDDHVVANLEHLALHDLALVDRRERTVVELHHLLVLGRRVFVFVVQLGTAVHERAQLRALRVPFFTFGHRGAGTAGARVTGFDLGHTERVVS